MPLGKQYAAVFHELCMQYRLRRTMTRDQEEALPSMTDRLKMKHPRLSLYMAVTGGNDWVEYYETAAWQS